MKLLFDTHAFIWWDGDQSKLSAEALPACQSTENSLHLSLASVWELQIKMQLGKLALRLPLADVLRDQQQQNGLVLEPVTLEDILAFRRFPHFTAIRSTASSSPRRIREVFISSLMIPNLPAIQWRCFGKWHRSLHALKRRESAPRSFPDSPLALVRHPPIGCSSLSLWLP